MAAKKILLLEDDDFYIYVIGTYVRLFLQAMFVPTKTVTIAFEKECAECPDLVIIDLETSSALDLVDRMRANGDLKRVPILALSQKEGRREEALSRGCTAFLAKPFKVRKLKQAIAELLDR